jgi:hypothetical protein
LTAPVRTREQVLKEIRRSYPVGTDAATIAACERLADQEIRTDRILAAAGEPPTCPPWCGYAPGHKYDGSETDRDAAARSHVADEWADVSLVQDEWNEGGVVTLGPLVIRQWSDDGHSTLDGTKARKLAAELAAMAVRYDEITASA